MRRCLVTGMFFVLAAACAPLPEGPSLSPRAAEKIDPRLPVADRSDALPGDPQFASALAALRGRALAAAADVEPALRAAESAVQVAGAPGSESWIAAQQLVSAAVAQRAPFTRALGDLDTLVAERIRTGARLVPSDLQLAEAVGQELAAVDRRQASTIDSFQRRLQR